MSFATDMLDMLTSAYNRTDIARLRVGEAPQTNIGKLMYLSGWGFDIIKEQAEKVKLWNDLDYKQGADLDHYGRDFGVLRGNAADEVYRIMIKVKTLSLLASGNLDTVIQAAASLFGVDAQDVKADEIFPAKIYLYINEDRLDEEHKNVADIIAGLMDRIKAAGVGIRIFYRTYHEAEARLYLGVLAHQFVRMAAEPTDSDTRIESTGGVLIGIGALTQIRAAYGPE